MKKILDLLEFKLGKKTPDYLYAKKQVMDYFYEGLKGLFSTLEENKIIQPCECKARLRQGYKDCICGGSGFKNKVKND